MYTVNAILADIANETLRKNEYNIHMIDDVMANISVQTVKLLFFRSVNFDDYRNKAAFPLS